MPRHMPADTVRVIATKAINHGAPCAESSYVGVAVKTQAAAAGAGSGTAQRQVGIGEGFTIIRHGMVEVPNTDSGVAALAKGAPLWITAATGVLVTAVGAGPPAILKFGTIVDVASERGLPTNRIRVDLDGKMNF